MQNIVTRLGNFWKFLATDFLRKVSQLFNNFRGYFENIILKVKTAVSTFWATFVEIWVTFYSNIWSHWFTVRLTANSNQKLFSTSEERNKKSFLTFSAFSSFDIRLGCVLTHSPAWLLQNYDSNWRPILVHFILLWHWFSAPINILFVLFGTAPSMSFLPNVGYLKGNSWDNVKNTFQL